MDIRYVGSGSLTGVVGTLSTTDPDVTIPVDSADFDDFFPGASTAQFDPFTVAVSSTRGCDPIPMTLVLSTNEGLFGINFDLPVGVNNFYYVSGSYETFDVPTSWELDSFWHIQPNSVCLDSFFGSRKGGFALDQGSVSPPNALVFNDEATCTYGCGSAVRGVARKLEVISIPAVAPELYIGFWEFADVDGLGTKGAVLGTDIRTVEVTDDGGATWTEVYSQEDSTGGWNYVYLPIPQYEGKDIELRFIFDSVDEFDNLHLGWYVDNVEVTWRVDDFLCDTPTPTPTATPTATVSPTISATPTVSPTATPFSTPICPVVIDTPVPTITPTPSATATAIAGIACPAWSGDTENDASASDCFGPGNCDGRIDPGEEGTFDLYLDYPNAPGQNNVFATFTTTDPLVNILSGVVSYGSAFPNSKMFPFDSVRIVVDPSRGCEPIIFDVAITSDESSCNFQVAYALGTRFSFSGSVSFDTMDDPANWTMTGYWHIQDQSRCPITEVNQTNHISFPNTLTFSDEDTCSLNCGTPVRGSATQVFSTQVPSDSQFAYLTFWQLADGPPPIRKAGEKGAAIETNQRIIEVSPDFGVTWVQVYFAVINTTGWQYEYVDISQFVGEQIIVRFIYDTVDVNDDGGIGWYIDDFEIGAEFSFYNCNAVVGTPTPTLTPSPSPSVSATPTVSPTISPTFTATLSPTQSSTPTPFVTPTCPDGGTTVVLTLTPSPTFTSTPTPTVSITLSPSVTVSATITTTPTLTPTITATVTPTLTPSITPTPTGTTGIPTPDVGGTSPGGVVCPTGTPFTPAPTSTPSPSPTLAVTATASPTASGPTIVSVTADGNTISVNHAGILDPPSRRHFIAVWYRLLNTQGNPWVYLGFREYTAGQTLATAAWPPLPDSRYQLAARIWQDGPGWITPSVFGEFTDLEAEYPEIGSVVFDPETNEIVVNFSRTGKLTSAIGIWHRKVIPSGALVPPVQSIADGAWTYQLRSYPFLTTEMRIPLDPGSDTYELAAALYVPGAGFFLPYTFGFATPETLAYPRLTGIIAEARNARAIAITNPVGNLPCKIGFWFREVDESTCEAACEWRFVGFTPYDPLTRFSSVQWFSPNINGKYETAMRLFLDDSAGSGFVDFFSPFVVISDRCNLTGAAGAGAKVFTDAEYPYDLPKGPWN